MLKNYSLILILISICSCLYSQETAVTESGDTIYVYDNGTWSYELLEEMPEIENGLSFLSDELILDTIATAFKVPKNAKKQISSSKNQFNINYDEKIWKRVPPATLNDDADFAFQAKSSDIWSVVIAEETSIDHDKLFLIAKNTMKDAVGSEPEVIKTELRNVNGVELMRGVMKADFSGIIFVFDTYYYSNELGSVQFTTWTSENVWKRNQAEILDLLNGFMPN